MSIRPNSREHLADHRLDLIGLADVARSARARRAIAASCARAPLELVGVVRPQIATFAPSRAISSAVASPMPEPPPVTMDHLISKDLEREDALDFRRMATASQRRVVVHGPFARTGKDCPQISWHPSLATAVADRNAKPFDCTIC